MAYGDSASSTTHAAIADEAITIRDKEGQQQDIATISRDTENAANSLDKIFNAEEEMRNLEAIGLGGQIVSQVTTIATNYGTMKAQDEARAKADAQKESAANDPAIVAQVRDNLKNSGNENPTQEDLNKATYDVVYQAEFKIANEKQMKEFGTGSDVQRAIQAAGAALTIVMGGGSAGNAAAAASAPYLAQGVKALTEGPEMKDKAINAIVHAIIGAAVAQASGNSAASGAIGAASGELMAQLITEKLYDGRKPEDLTEAERQTVAALSMIAAGAVGGVAGDSTESAVTSANAGYNAAVNNYLSLEESTRKQYLEGKEAKGEITGAERQELKQINETDKSRNEALAQACSGGSVTACNEQQKLVHNALDTYKGEAEYQTQYDLREQFPEQMAKYGDLIGDYSREIIGLVDQGYTPEQAKSYIDQRIANDKAYADKYQKALDEIPGWAKIAMTVQDTAGMVYGAKAVGDAFAAQKAVENSKLIVTANTQLEQFVV